MFSIIIPTWNNLPFLKLCIQSLLKNSAHPHQIIIHINEGSDGTLEWVRAQGLSYTASIENIGVCYAVNQASLLAIHPYIIFMNDDMYCCPGWDTALLEAVKQGETDCFLLFSRLIEPMGREGVTLIRDFGRNPSSFDESGLLTEVKNLPTVHWHGLSQPTLIAREWWVKIGGYSIEFSPGMGSDNDLAMKMWFAGCRRIQIVGNSWVYHFGERSTKRLRKKNNSRLEFMRKWGISTSMFNRYYLRVGTRSCEIAQSEPEVSLSFRWQWFRVRLVMLFSIFKKIQTS